MAADMVLVSLFSVIETVFLKAHKTSIIIYANVSIFIEIA